MSLVVNCPSCDARVTAPHSAVGKRVKCPKCGTGIAVTDDEDDDRPVKSRRRDEDDEDDDRPKRKARRRDEDDEDDRPRRKKSAGKKSGPPVILFVALGGGVVVLGVVATVLFFLFGGKPTGPGGVFGPSAPAGFSTVSEPGVGVRLFLPGQVRGSHVRKGGPDGPPDPNHYLARGESGGVEAELAAYRTPGFKPGMSDAQLLEAYEKAFVSRPLKYDVTDKKQVSLGGQAGLEIRISEKPDLWDDTPDKAEFFKDKNNQERARVAREGKRIVAFVVARGEWSYVIQLVGKVQEPDAATVKTVADSITFN